MRTAWRRSKKVIIRPMCVHFIYPQLIIEEKICVSVGPISKINKIVAGISVSAPCKWTIFWLPELIRTSLFWRLIHLFFRWHANMDNLDHGKKNFQLQRWRIRFLSSISVFEVIPMSIHHRNFRVSHFFLFVLFPEILSHCKEIYSLRVETFGWKMDLWASFSNLEIKLKVENESEVFRMFSNNNFDCAADNLRSSPVLDNCRRHHPTWTRCAAAFPSPAFPLSMQKPTSRDQTFHRTHRNRRQMIST